MNKDHEIAVKVLGQNDTEKTNMGLEGDAHFYYSSSKAFLPTFLNYEIKKNTPALHSGETKITFPDQIK